MKAALSSPATTSRSSPARGCRRMRSATPLYAPPADLVEIDPDHPPAGIEPGYRFARQDRRGDRPYLDRGEIERGALRGQGLEVAWLADPVDAFFIHVQGSARLRLAEGGEMRVTYAAKTGHPYTGDRPRADRDGRAAEGRRDDADDPRLARCAPRTRRRR